MRLCRGNGVLGILIRVAGRRSLLMSWLAVGIGRVRRRRLRKVRCGLGLLPHYEFRCDRRINVLIQLKANAAASRSDKDLDRNLALCLGSVVEVDNGMHALGNLALQHRLPREPRIEVHNIRLQSLGMEGALHPADEIPRDFLEQKDLDVGNVSPEAARQVKSAAAVGWGPAVGAGAPASVRVVTMAVEALG